jgi:hypothetical protein
MGCAEVIFTLETRNEPELVAASDDVIMHIHFDGVSGVISAGSMFALSTRTRFGLGLGGVVMRGTVLVVIGEGGLA